MNPVLVQAPKNGLVATLVRESEPEKINTLIRRIEQMPSAFREELMADLENVESVLNGNNTVLSKGTSAVFFKNLNTTGKAMSVFERFVDLLRNLFGTRNSASAVTQKAREVQALLISKSVAKELQALETEIKTFENTSILPVEGQQDEDFFPRLDQRYQDFKSKMDEYENQKKSKKFNNEQRRAELVQAHAEGVSLNDQLTVLSNKFAKDNEGILKLDNLRGELTNLSNLLESGVGNAKRLIDVPDGMITPLQGTISRASCEPNSDISIKSFVAIELLRKLDKLSDEEILISFSAFALYAEGYNLSLDQSTHLYNLHHQASQGVDRLPELKQFVFELILADAKRKIAAGLNSLNEKLRGKEEEIEQIKAKLDYLESLN